ncbi:hypothetical protein A3860_19915 [Niastella vici]|uniref:Pyridoxamine 5'-phosphate oxidase N-terminal domain-containing protein n=1 Tax=Niastella vici TaxID=1703345 RepID=A0A1V9G1A0_9BACT|nr:pyridoxamine 5'-phosphate oxidase family protein [Niastella vici]OQP64246.1 hypothetical protein A3860_19915 [Niastella vici]
MSKFITEEMMPAFEGVIPAVIASCSADGIPNVTYISQVYYVDEQHVAISRQFFNKTICNITENPMAQVILTCPVTYAIYKMLLRFRESQSLGPVFEEMTLQLEVIAGVQGKSGVFHLLAADIYEILEINQINPV